MTLNKVIKRNNRPLTYKIPSRYGSLYSIGGMLGLGNKLAIDSLLKGALGSAGSAVGLIGGSLIGEGLNSGIGNSISTIGGTIGGVVGTTNPLLGGIVSAGSGLLGGITNKLFGSKLNLDEISKIDNTNNQLNLLQIAGGDNNSIQDLWNNTDFGDSFTQNDIGKDGWFNNKAKNKYNSLLAELTLARNKAINAFLNATSNADMSLDNLVQSNFIGAYGGFLPVNNIYASGGVLDEYNSNLKLFDLGGVLQGDGADWSTGITPINNGGTHEENPNDGVQMGTDNEGTPNLVEEGEVKWNNYIFSNRLNLNKDLLLQIHLPLSLADHTFAAAAKNLGRESKERPNDPVSLNGLLDSLSKLAMALEYTRQSQQQESMKNRKYANGGLLLAPFMQRADGSYPADDNRPVFKGNLDNTTVLSYSILQPSSDIQATTPSKSTTSLGYDASQLRYAPVIGSGLAALSDMMGWTNKPNYTNADMIAASVRGRKSVGYNPIGSYLTYTPIDKNLYASKLDALTNASRRDIINQSGGNRATAMAGILANNYNSLEKLGDLMKSAEEYNQGLKLKVADFNRGTDQFNSEESMKAQMANLANDRLGLEASILSSRLRDEIANRAAATKSANLSNFFNNIGAVGLEEFSRNMIRSNPGVYYGIDSNGNIIYKPQENKKSCGGLLTVRNKGRRR